MASAKCPENKGIETATGTAAAGTAASAKCPENKGIETGLGSSDAETLARQQNALKTKGLRRQPQLPLPFDPTVSKMP